MFVVLRVFTLGEVREVRRSHEGVFLTEAAANAHRLVMTEMTESLGLLDNFRHVVYSPSELADLESSGVVIRTR